MKSPKQNSSDPIGLITGSVKQYTDDNEKAIEKHHQIRNAIKQMNENDSWREIESKSPQHYKMFRKYHAAISPNGQSIVNDSVENFTTEDSLNFQNARKTEGILQVYENINSKSLDIDQKMKNIKEVIVNYNITFLQKQLEEQGINFEQVADFDKKVEAPSLGKFSAKESERKAQTKDSSCNIM